MQSAKQSAVLQNQCGLGRLIFKTAIWSTRPTSLGPPTELLKSLPECGEERRSFHVVLGIAYQDADLPDRAPPALHDRKRTWWVRKCGLSRERFSVRHPHKRKRPCPSARSPPHSTRLVAGLTIFAHVGGFAAE